MYYLFTLLASGIAFAGFYILLKVFKLKESIVEKCFPIVLIALIFVGYICLQFHFRHGRLPNPLTASP